MNDYLTATNSGSRVVVVCGDGQVMKRTVCFLLRSEEMWIINGNFLKGLQPKYKELLWAQDVYVGTELVGYGIANEVNTLWKKPNEAGQAT